MSVPAAENIRRTFVARGLYPRNCEDCFERYNHRMENVTYCIVTVFNVGLQNRYMHMHPRRTRSNTSRLSPAHIPSSGGSPWLPSSSYPTRSDHTSPG